MAGESKIVVYGALFGNLAIAVTKFFGAAITGSSAMLSEGIHSTVDTGNQILLLVGMKLSQRPADAEHPFGHGKELFFWALIVAVLIFGVGGGVSAYEGVVHIQHPAPLTDPKWNYIVLGFAFVFEGTAFVIALRAFNQARGERPFWKSLLESKEPTTYTVLAEDSAALAGIVVAALGVYLSHAWNMPVLDGAASIVIGLILAVVAVFLVYQSRGLLVGEGVRPETSAELKKIAASIQSVQGVSNPMTMYIGPEEILLNLDVTFEANATSSDVAGAVEEMERKIRDRFPRIKRIFIEAKSLTLRSESKDGAVSRKP